ncbi:TetR/AcrR family transcriptional regulator [Streptomyces sparsogenes]|uniref:TetR family transcriptional regulator n=1 Tax=Streptomyces sparsogenes DSM 40356 TaxID=1331668 RepID=A0A1R1S728_9ACTN|nr:TetR/AcrR family transcriptional regulator [Streptomyces sparsogenes]OMI34115.1 TetR family transcriptional regulator [Streptomyces sparsogenes DSM 40356]
MTETKADQPAGEAKPRRRQARGERRIQQLLDAAASVFCRAGYAGASTNAIAREAGVSPGTLYQFFPNKEAIAVELGERLTHRMREAHGVLFTPEYASLPLDRMLDAVVDPMVEFNCQNPVFLTLIHSGDIPGLMTEDHDALHVALQARLEELIGFIQPALPPERRTRTATMVFSLFKAGLELVLAHEGGERAAYIEELKASLHGYLAPIIGAETPSRTP